MNRFIVVLVVVLVLIAAACCCCGSSGLDEFLSLLSVTSTPEPTPVIIRELPGDLGAETELLLETTVVPVRDLHDLAIRLRGVPSDTPRTVNPEGSPDYPVGTRRLFHASNVDTDEDFDLYAEPALD